MFVNILKIIFAFSASTYSLYGLFKIAGNTPQALVIFLLILSVVVNSLIVSEAVLDIRKTRRAKKFQQKFNTELAFKKLEASE